MLLPRRAAYPSLKGGAGRRFFRGDAPNFISREEGGPTLGKGKGNKNEVKVALGRANPPHLCFGLGGLFFLPLGGEGEKGGR